VFESMQVFKIKIILFSSSFESGVLDASELKAFLDDEADAKLSENEMRLAMAFFDENNDQKVNLEEFIKCILAAPVKKSRVTKESFSF
jgi:hypothetical protein